MAELHACVHTHIYQQYIYTAIYYSCTYRHTGALLGQSRAKSDCRTNERY